MPTPSSTAGTMPARHSPRPGRISPPTGRPWVSLPHSPRASASAHERNHGPSPMRLRGLGAAGAQLLGARGWEPRPARRLAMTRKQRRAMFIVLPICVLALAALLVAVALRDTIVFFLTPRE